MGDNTMEDSTDARIDRLSGEVAELRELIERRLHEDGQRQRMYDELYRQLEFARKGLTEEFLAPIAREVLLVLDRIDALDASTPEVESVREELAEILVRRGIRSIDAVGERFDPRAHEAVGRVEVSAPEEAGVVIEVRRIGYALGERLLRPAQVVVGVPPSS